MKYNVRFSPFAKEDKKEIKIYLSKFYTETPRRFTTALKEYINNLKNNPYIYPEYPENTDYHRMFVNNYVVFYKINDTEKQIDIYRILRASWDLPKYL
ncbi:MAG: type II toxin-antitoxin system RelE/ParE family toxin [Treponema sp.]|nr:type II toxin-antitoxin system RelE/ParE family toxin [Treponema sp.]